MEKRELTCIGCPLGCQITVEMEQGEIKKLTGNTCKRGEDYARKEVTHPSRIVTSTVRVRGGDIPVVSCKTEKDIPKEKIMDIMKYINEAAVEAPVYAGDVLIENVADTGVNVIATKDAGKAV